MPILRRGTVTTSRTGRTKYAVVGFTLSSIEPGGVQLFIQGPRGLRGLIRDGSLARRLRRQLFRSNGEAGSLGR